MKSGTHFVFEMRFPLVPHEWYPADGCASYHQIEPSQFIEAARAEQTHDPIDFGTID